MEKNDYGCPVDSNGYPMLGGYDSQGRLCYANGMPVMGGGEASFFIFPPLILMFFFFPFVYSFVVGIYGAMIVLFHEPTEADFQKDYYKFEAAEAAEKFLLQIRKDAWEKQGVVVVTSDDRNWFWADLRLSYLDGKYWSGYENQTVARVYDATPMTRLYCIDLSVDYEGDQTYRVKTTMNMKICAVDENGKALSSAPQKYEYVSVVKCDPKRRFYGRVHMNWELLENEVNSVSASDEEVVALAENARAEAKKTPMEKLRESYM